MRIWCASMRISKNRRMANPSSHPLLDAWLISFSQLLLLDMQMVGCVAWWWIIQPFFWISITTHRLNPGLRWALYKVNIQVMLSKALISPCFDTFLLWGNFHTFSLVTSLPVLSSSLWLFHVIFHCRAEQCVQSICTYHSASPWSSLPHLRCTFHVTLNPILSNHLWPQQNCPWMLTWNGQCCQAYFKHKPAFWVLLLSFARAGKSESEREGFETKGSRSLSCALEPEASTSKPPSNGLTFR